MANLGILDMIGLAASLVFALPVGVFGLNRLLDGQTVLGGGLVVVAVAMVLLPQKLTTPMDLPADLAGAAVGTVAKTPEEDEERDRSE
ncbi:DUF7533 family protein [Halalkalicoccus jeotgali]|uniref:Uncharacterized protein n=1 Tax=Halalkalicoccus jeotgali (strain DSM 18796 / CECT 7217 / JCM 14584 / KCTC 4019 / B3) TaxID=795797 RepID=D8J7R6_HALJB|nr:hypothetical protein [Halalkalicoccus jeotgali]ADJ16086.1 hypothetical protein HacjB3_13525 [Halalkalicoccus jeotgali B3]ELY38181.1 hypothetical protein C497_08734 [Halalkalicoccus jeotgali B3]